MQTSSASESGHINADIFCLRVQTHQCRHLLPQSPDTSMQTSSASETGHINPVSSASHINPVSSASEIHQCCVFCLRLDTSMLCLLPQSPDTSIHVFCLRVQTHQYMSSASESRHINAVFSASDWTHLTYLTLELEFIL